MKKLLKGKLDQGGFWISFIIIWGVEIALLMAGRDTSEPIESWRLVALLVVLVFYLAVIALRLRDIGKGMGQLLICFIIPIYAIVIGCMPSKQEYICDDADEKKDFNY